MSLSYCVIKGKEWFGLTIKTMPELFELCNIENNLCSQTDFSLGAIYTTNYGLRSLRYLAPNICNMIPKDIRNVNNLSDFTLKKNLGCLMFVLVNYAKLIYIKLDI